MLLIPRPAPILLRLRLQERRARASPLRSCRGIERPAFEPLDKTSTNQGTGSAIASLAGPTTQSGEFLFGFVARAATVGPTVGPTDRIKQPRSLMECARRSPFYNPAVISAYGIESGTGNFAVKWTTSSANFVALCASFFATVVAAVPGKRSSRQRQQAPVVRKRPINRVVHEEPSLGSFVLFAPVKRGKPARKTVLNAVRVKARAVRRRSARARHPSCYLLACGGLGARVSRVLSGRGRIML